ncbi:hypothetical protein SDC9_112196 [bioreactor metagenome]|uniref:Uncharacterized protein n=1 Tax=bioreactor metagenome TaxID=1076179 RepID=A0A645BL88_9ZZZZ
MRNHNRVHAGGDCADKRHKVVAFEFLQCFIHRGRNRVGVLGSAAVAGEMLCAGEDSARVQALDHRAANGGGDARVLGDNARL